LRCTSLTLAHFANFQTLFSDETDKNVEQNYAPIITLYGGTAASAAAMHIEVSSEFIRIFPASAAKAPRSIRLCRPLIHDTAASRN